MRNDHKGTVAHTPETSTFFADGKRGARRGYHWRRTMKGKRYGSGPYATRRAALNRANRMTPA